MECFGHFDCETDEYVVTTPTATKSQENFLFNDRYFAVVNQCGNGVSRYNSPECVYTDIVAGAYKPSFQHNTRVIYLRDDETGGFWNAGYFPRLPRLQRV